LIILDTNVISEAIKREPSPVVRAWLAGIDRAQFCTTAITAAELKAGAAALDPGRRRDALISAIDQVLADDLGGRILPLDERCTPHFAEITARRRRLGVGWEPMDMLIASIALRNGFPVATRDVSGFEETGVDIINPWTT
jgi:toxin FitB